jgi:hypothetical protein
MPTVADCLRQHAPAYLAKFGEAVPLGHRKVISAITRCRTGELGASATSVIHAIVSTGLDVHVEIDIAPTAVTKKRKSGWPNRPSV